MSEPEEETPVEEPAAATPAPEEPPEELKDSVEALLGLRDFLALAPQRRTAASTKAAEAALTQWMRRHGHDTNGFYTMDDWQTYYHDTMAHTGAS